MANVSASDPLPEYFSREQWISSFALRTDDVPDPNGPLDAIEDDNADRQQRLLPPIWRFALTFPGERWLPLDDLYGFHRHVFGHFIHRGELPDQLTFDACRALLYFEEHYQWRKDFDSPWAAGHPDHANFVRALLRAIYKTLHDDEWAEAEVDMDEWQRKGRRLARTSEALSLVRIYEYAYSLLEQVDAADHLRTLEPPSDDPLVVYEFDLVRRLALNLVDEAAGSGQPEPLAAAREKANDLAWTFKP